MIPFGYCLGGILVGGILLFSIYSNRNKLKDLKDLDSKIENAKAQIDNLDLQQRIRIKQYTSENLEMLKELQELKDSISAGIQAKLREQQSQEEKKFYKIEELTQKDYLDIEKLNKFKETLFNPIPINKLIWSQYFQRPVTEMCNHILGKEKVCGIYKITNLLTEEVYIGQSVDIANRWKEHCKCGLGIDASSTNRLYQSMQKDGIWNFSFELLEACNKEDLNTKEKRFIDLYQSNKFGFNMTKGGS